MIDTEEIIHRHCAGNSELEQLLLQHSRDVARRALQVADRHPELGLNREFLQEAAMLHDIGITLVDAPGIHCHGQEPYIRHGLMGGEILRQEGLPMHATASLFGKAVNNQVSDEDIAKGIIMMVIETIGSAAVLSTLNSGIKDFCIKTKSWCRIFLYRVWGLQITN